MYILLALLLFITPVYASDSSELCQEIREVIEEHKELGLINEQEAEELLGRCARRR